MVISGLISYPVFDTGFCAGNISFLYWPFCHQKTSKAIFTLSFFFMSHKKVYLRYRPMDGMLPSSTGVEIKMF